MKASINSRLPVQDFCLDSWPPYRKSNAMAISLTRSAVVSTWPSAGLFRLVGDAANQAVRVVAHSGISLRVDACHLGDGFPVWVGVFADDIQRVEGKH